MDDSSAELNPFEAALRRDLPRGLEKPPGAAGRDRGLSAHWLGAEELSGDSWNPAGALYLGTRVGRVIGWNDDRHMLTIAGTRAGKGVSLIIPNLLLYQGSAVVIDPKGENAARTAGRRGKGTRAGGPGLNQDVHVLDPFGESGLPSAAFNPLEGLKAGSPDVIEEIGLFADALITHPEIGERHWTESAQSLLRALILLVVSDPRFDGRRNLVTVRRLLSLSDPAIEKVQDDYDERQREESRDRKKKLAKGDEQTDDAESDDPERLPAYKALIKLLMDQEGMTYGYICSGVGEQLMAMGYNERGSVLSTARTQTQWLDSPKMHPVLSRSDFNLEDLKSKPTTIYLCLPASRLATHARWLRLMILLSLGVMERVKVRPKLPVLFVLDEFPALGYMQSIETAAGLMAGFGVKLWPIVQDIGQLKRHYSRSWETFFANSGVVTAFGVSDSESLKVLSMVLGRTGIVVKVDSGATRNSLNQGAAAYHDDRREVPLLAEHELRLAFARSKDRALVCSAESNPGVVKRFTYFKDPLFKGLYDPDPNYAPIP